MATSVRKLLDQVSDPSTKAAYSELCFKHAKDAATKAQRVAPFAVTDQEALTLERLGITTSPFATTSHTHAGDKIIENDCLSLIGSYLPKTAVTMIQLKRSKIHLMNRGPNQDVFANYCHEPKDVLRYGITNPGSCPRVHTEYAVLADTLHFMSTKQLLALFLKNPKLQKLFATLVLPIEALHRLPSLFPEIYRLEYYKEHFAYMPGGHGGGAYVHSYATLNWLSTGQVGTHTNNVISVGYPDYLSLEKIETKAAHHVMLIQRRRTNVPWPVSPLWVFHASDYVRLPQVYYPPEANVQNTYPHDLIKRMQAYCLSVKAVSLRDIFAKLRQVIETQDLKRYSMADLIRLANYLLLTTAMEHVSDYECLLTKGWVAKLSARIQMRVRGMLESIRGKTSYSALLSVADVIPVPFTTIPIRRPSTGLDWEVEEANQEEPREDMPGPETGPNLEDLELVAQFEENPARNSAAEDGHGKDHSQVVDELEKALYAEKPPSSSSEDDNPPENPNGEQSDHTAQPSESANVASLDKPTVEILKLHGFTALTPQWDGESWIQPVYFNPSNGKLPVSPLQDSNHDVAKLAHSIKRNLYQYAVDNKRAASYMSDVKNNLTGLVLPKLDRDKLSAWVSLCENAERHVSILVIHGAGGAGKSRCLQEALRNSKELAENVNVIVPTVNLVLDWKKKMNSMDPRRFMTFEKACEREAKEVAVFDDYGKLPAGYVDAYIAIKPTVEIVILTGDQRQSVYHNGNKDAQTANLTDNVTHFRKFCDYYVNATHRQPRRIANPIKVHAERQFGGAVTMANLIQDKATVLVPAYRTQSALTDLGRQAYTYSGCQGLTISDVTIALDNDTPLCSNEVLYTAFSRASESITFVNTHSDNPDFLAKLDSTPYLKTLITGVREDEKAGHAEPPAEAAPQEPEVKTHLPVANGNVALEEKIEAVEDKDTRELWDGQEKTNLMQTQDPVIQLFPHQQAKDEPLFKLTIEKRIRTASASENQRAIIKSCNAGDLLFEAYADFMKVPKEPQNFDRDLWLHCKQLALRTYLSKPTSNLQQGATRQDPDFPEAAIALFNKSQWVKKLEKVGFKFKPGQTISAFKQSTVLLTTTMALYLRKKREEHQPDNVFIMCEKTPDQFNDFVMTRWDFSRPSYTSDYEQYDQSQDAAFLNFELRKARHLGVPEEILSFYKFVKIHAKTFVGNLAIMRLSGEGPTFDANTECNIAYDALRFHLDNNVNACYAGDDLVRDRVCDERPSWQYTQHLFSLRAKPLATNKPDFCGWRLTKYGIIKSPVQLYQSLQLALRLNKMDEVRRSYAIDYQYAYRLQDKLFEVFDEREMDHHQLATRLLIKKGAQVPDIGNHLPMHHVTSDRLIKNPHYREMHDAESDRIYMVAPSLTENHFT
uniref:RdRp n=1 Tax=Arachis pintoi virus TaxID=1921009 RepID=A0A3G1GJ41_9VIRU|nr:RdRp [Arachis pintoi virus]